MKKLLFLTVVLFFGCTVQEEVLDSYLLSGKWELSSLVIKKRGEIPIGGREIPISECVYRSQMIIDALGNGVWTAYLSEGVECKPYQFNISLTLNEDSSLTIKSEDDMKYQEIVTGKVLSDEEILIHSKIRFDVHSDFLESQYFFKKLE